MWQLKKPGCVINAILKSLYQGIDIEK
ncbi:hypothetical protein LCGC14_2589820, partial [marine sediment metagenome]